MGSHPKAYACRRQLGLAIQLVLKAPDLFGDFQAHRQFPKTVVFPTSMPKVRPLPSTVVTRFLGTMSLSDSHPGLT